MSRRLSLRRATKSKGFTLIELLVVIAIIALLISILLPSLEQARQQAKANVCISHIKGVATSSRVYEADDENGWGIPAHPLYFTQTDQDTTHIGAYEWGGKAGVGRQDWKPGYGGDYAFLGSKYGTLAGFGPATRTMNDILYPGGFTDYLNTKNGRFDREGATRDTELSLDLFKCPSDEGPPRGQAHCPDWVRSTERSSYDHFGNSFAANIFMTSYVGGGDIFSNSPYLRPISRIPTPPRTLYYEENIGRWAWDARREKDDCIAVIGDVGYDPGPTKAVAGWHGKDWTFQRSFVDGHAESQKLIIAGTEDSEGFFEHYRTELVYPEDMDRQDRTVCIIVRGPGWQKDTLPATGIFTGLSWGGEGRVSAEACPGF